MVREGQGTLTNIPRHQKKQILAHLVLDQVRWHIGTSICKGREPVCNLNSEEEKFHWNLSMAIWLWLMTNSLISNSPLLIKFLHVHIPVFQWQVTVH